jgi:1-acyl-sn-glycerol-3-phosphate acyltransferase
MWYWIGFSLAWLWLRLFFRLRIVGRDKIIASWESGGVLIACNHTSYFDPPVVGVAYGKKTAFLARKSLFKKGFLGWIYPRLNAIPVDQERPDFTSLKRIIKELRDGNPVLIFPEGQRSLNGKLLEAEAGVGLVVAKSRVPVLPMRIFGAHEAYPPGAKMPRFFTRITLCCGEMFEFSDADLDIKGREGYQSIADRVMKEIAEIKKP